MSPYKPAPIAIVGGGPCGLLFARLLESAGIDYVVFERELSRVPSRADQGGSLDIHPGTGQDALRRAGLYEKFIKLARYDATVFTFQDYEGKHKNRIGEGRDAPEIDRLQLRNIMLDTLPAHRIQWGKTLQSVEKKQHITGPVPAAGYVLRFTDGSAASGFRLLVAADGAWSKLRSLVTPNVPQYSGKMFVEGHLSQNNPQYQAAVDMVGPGNSMALAKSSALCVQQMSDRTYRVYMGIDAPKSTTRPGGEIDLEDLEKARPAMLSKFFDCWAPHLRAFVAAAEGPWRAWALHQLDPETFKTTADGGTWTRTPGVVLMGDAAHLAVPNGEGVNQALYDALVLFEKMEAELGIGKDAAMAYDGQADAEALERAVAAYEVDMLPRAREHVLDGISLFEKMWSDAAAQNFMSHFTGPQELSADQEKQMAEEKGEEASDGITTAA